MATFKAGQRVKLIQKDPAVFFMKPLAIGDEGVVLAGSPQDKTLHRLVRFDRFPDVAVGCFDYELAPLTDPKADAFVESIKKMKPYCEPTITKEKA